MTEAKNILILSLGFTPDVFRSTMQSFKADLPSVQFDKVIIVCNTNLKKGEAKKKLDEAISKAGVSPNSVKKVFSNNDDLVTQPDNLEFFKMVFGEIEQAKKAGFKVYVNIAGGRKQMSALLLVAAYLSGAEKIFHTYFDGGHEKEKIGLIEIPYLHLYRPLQSVVLEFDRENRFNGSIAKLIAQVETDEAFKLLNQYLDEQSRYKNLRELFAEKKHLYESMIGASEMIVRNAIGDKVMFRPQFQSRVKDFDSFYKKILRKEECESRISDPFKRFVDIAGLRVIFYNSADRDRAVKLLQSSGEFVNYSNGRKLKGEEKEEKYGYRAVHFDAVLNPAKRGDLNEYKNLGGVPCEIQFTTIFSHTWGVIHHVLSYKDDRVVSLSEEKQRQMDIEFAVAAKGLENLEKDITNLSTEFYPEKNKRKI